MGYRFYKSKMGNNEFIGKCQIFLDEYKKCKQLLKYGIIATIIFGACAALNIINRPIMICFMLISAAFLLFTSVKNVKIKDQKIKLQYFFDDEDNPYQHVQELMDILGKCENIQCAKSLMTNVKERTNAGATNIYDLQNIKIQNACPVFLDTNVKCYYIKLPKEELYILPDKLIVVDNYRIGAIDLRNIEITLKETSMRIFNEVARDTEILGYTWKYVNQDGTPDRRYKDNREIPICKYGKLHIESKEGLNILLFASNYEISEKFYRKWHEKKEISKAKSELGGIEKMQSSNKISDKIYDGNNKERYLLGEKGKNPLICIGANPSIATDMQDDPTIKKIRKIANANQCDGWIMLNLYPQRSKDPSKLHKNCDKELVDKNICAIKEIFEIYPDAITLLAWGNIIDSRAYLKENFINIVNLDRNRKWYIRDRLTQKGNPMHQLYVADKAQLVPVVISDDGKISLYNNSVKEKEHSTADEMDIQENYDELLPKAIELAVSLGKISTAMVQHHFEIGYARAGRIIDQMESLGIIAGMNGSKPRDVLVSQTDKSRRS